MPGFSTSNFTASSLRLLKIPSSFSRRFDHEIMENNILSIRLGAEPVTTPFSGMKNLWAMKTRDPDKAEHLMLKHIQDIQKALEMLEKGSSPAKNQIDLSEKTRLNIHQRR